MIETKNDKMPSRGVRPESELPGGNLTSKAKRAIAEEVPRRRRLGLPIAMDHGNGVEYLQ